MKSNTIRFARKIDSMFSRGGTLVVLASILILFPMIAFGAATVDLAWDANTELDLDGYKIYYGTASGVYSHSVDVRTQAAGRNPACGSPYDPFKTECCEYTLPLDPGTYYLAAKAYDLDGNESAYSAELVHTITENSAPVADAGPAQTVLVGDTVILDGSGSTDVDGDPLTYEWSFSSPPNSVAALDVTDPVHPTFVVDLPGTYVVQLVVSDGQVDSTPSTVDINTGNSAPVADAGPAQTVLVGDTVILDGSGSTDVDGDPLTYEWSFSSPPNSVAALDVTDPVHPTFVVDLPGTYVVQLVVSDGQVDSTPSTVDINTGNSAPVADAGPAQTVLVGDTVILDGSGSTDVDGDPLTYEWSFSSPPNSVAALDVTDPVHPTFVVDLPGTYVVQLVVSDGQVDSTPSTVDINTGNSAPVADAGPAQTVLVGDTVILDGSGSTDVDGDPLTYEWSFSSPPNSVAALDVTDPVHPTFVVDLPGTYVVQLVVSDGQVDSTPSTVDINTGNSAPVADAGPAQTVLVGDTVILDGSGSTDVDGDPLTYEWSFSSPPNSVAALDVTDPVHPTFVVDLPGTYVVQLVVSDGQVDSTPSTVDINTGNSAPVADAGPAQTVLVGDTVILDGSGSTDVDGDPLTYEWSFSSPPNSVAALDVTDPVHPTFVVDLPGTYVVQLVVSDGQVDSTPSTVDINTGNSAPVADAGPAQTVLVGDTVILDGSGSTDVNGDPLTYEWSFSSPPNSVAALDVTDPVHPTFVVDLPGTYVVQLVVSDGQVDSTPSTVDINTGNSAPVADAGPAQTVLVGDTVILDGSGSTDVDGDPLTYEWSFSSPPNSVAALDVTDPVHPTFVVDLPGTYVVQLVVSDGQVDSTPSTVDINTGNSAPVADAGPAQTVLVGDTVILDGSGSTDVNGDPLTYEWSFSSPPNSVAALDVTDPVHPTFVVDLPGTYVVQLVVSDGQVDSTPSTVDIVTDSDGDGVPDDEDAFPDDKNEHLDTDRDGIGNNEDEDDDGDFMPDTWESTYGLDPLIWDADGDPDGDGVSNYDEYYYFGTDPNDNEGNFKPYPPLLKPRHDENEPVSLTPLLETEEFDDPNYNDVHSQTQWEIMRAEGEFIVYDVTTSSSLTALTVPKLILEYDTDYIWRVKFIDNYGGDSDWSEAGYFTTEFSEADSDGNGILDHQEVDDSLDLDKDGVADREQSDIKCIVADSGKAQIGISIRDAENVDSILSLEIEEPDDDSLILKSKGKPSFIEFGLLHFKLLLNAPGEETVVTIHLSRAAFDRGKMYKRSKRYNNVKMYKYNPVNTEWLDYSEYAEFSSDRKKVYLTLKDGGFGDADGIENGIIVDPLAFGSDSDLNSGSGSDSDDSLIPDNISCFIAAASSDAANMQPLCKWREIGTRELSIVFILMVLGYVGTEIFLRFRQKRGDEAKSIGRIAM